VAIIALNSGGFWRGMMLDFAWSDQSELLPQFFTAAYRIDSGKGRISACIHYKSFLLVNI
jgi:hypothetical protein